MCKRIHSRSRSRSKASGKASQFPPEEKVLARDEGWIVGCAGAGKSSGSCNEIARSFLESGFGKLIVSAKGDHRPTVG
jgi:hypothetical protein